MGVLSYYVANILPKLYENERIWTQGGCASLAPPWIRQCLYNYTRYSDCPQQKGNYTSKRHFLGNESPPVKAFAPEYFVLSM